MIKRVLCTASVLLAASYSYSYSDTVNGITNNVTTNGYVWSMPDVLPPQSSLTVGGVVYRYTTQKEVEDMFRVIIENQNAVNGSLVFQNIDDWSGLPGTTINRSVPIDNIPLEYWGQGEIRTEGDGSISNVNIQYTYKYDSCFVVLSDPTCPGYANALLDYLNSLGLLGSDIDASDEYWNEYVNGLLETDVREEEIKEEEPEEEEKEEEETLEDGLRIASAAESIAEGVSQAAMLQAIAFATDISSYTAIDIQGGVYEETLQLKDKNIPDNRSASIRMGLAQDKIHNELVDLQYDN